MLPLLNVLCNEITVVFAFTNWDRLMPRTGVLTEFLESFWNPLVTKICEDVTWRHRIPCIGILVCNEKLTDDCLTPLHQPCGAAGKSRHDVLTPPNWTLQDVDRWLELHAGVPGTERDALMQKILRGAQEGHPWEIYSKLIAVAKGMKRK